MPLAVQWGAFETSEPLAVLTFDDRPAWAEAAEGLIRSHYLDSLEYGLDSRVTLLYYHLDNRSGYAFGDDQLYFAASTVKVALALGVGMYIEAGYFGLDTVVFYESERDWDPWANYLTEQELLQGATVESLLFNMLAYSCNVSTNMLLKITNFQAHHVYLAAIGYPMEMPDRNLLTPEQCLMTFYDLYQQRELPYYARVIDWLNQTNYHLRLDRDLPEEVVVIHKYGDFDIWFHDVGIVFAPEPYLLLVYTEEVADPNALISALSLLIYESQSGIMLGS